MGISSSNTTTQQHNNTTTQQHNNTTTQQHNNTTTQQHNNTTTQQHNNRGGVVIVARRLRKPQATWQRLRPHPCCHPQELWMDVLWESKDRRDCVHQCSKTKGNFFFYVTDIPYSTRTIRGNNSIPWCQWEHLLEDLTKYLRVRSAGLKLFIVSLDNPQCCFCIGCLLSLDNIWAKMCVIRDIFVLSYSFWLVPYSSGHKNHRGIRTAH
jgi:hypothetical protein